MSSFLDWLDRMWLVLALSLLGGFAYAAKQQEVTFWAWFCATVVAVFSGLVTHMLLADVSWMTETLRTALSSVSAYSGGRFLDGVLGRMAHLTGEIFGGKGR